MASPYRPEENILSCPPEKRQQLELFRDHCIQAEPTVSNQESDLLLHVSDGPHVGYEGLRFQYCSTMTLPGLCSTAFITCSRDDNDSVGKLKWTGIM